MTPTGLWWGEQGHDALLSGGTLACVWQAAAKQGAGVGSGEVQPGSLGKP